AGFTITTFGEDESGELYVANADRGIIYQILGAAGPRILPSGIVNAASFAPGLVAGSLATVFAAGVLDTPSGVSPPQIPLPSTLANIGVTVNGTTAPILAVANQNGTEQVNFQVPFEVAGQSSATVVVTRSGSPSPSATAPLLAVQPAIYTSDGTQAIVVH